MNHQQEKLEIENKDVIIDSLILLKAELGDPVVQLEVGKAYFSSGYTEGNRLNTFEWVSRSAKQGNLEAQFRLGDLYALGWGIKQCHTSAYEWYTKAAIRGYKKALIRIHNMYQEDIKMHCRGQLNASEKQWNGYHFKVEKKIRELNEYRLQISKSILNGAIDYYTEQFKKFKASDQDDPFVQQYLGFLYQHGYGTKKYTSVAIDYYTKAAEQGLVDAQYNLGFLYQHNTKIKFNYRKAFCWYSLAAKGENMAAQTGLAYLYEKGLATDINYQQALHWYTKAANSGHSGAQVTLGKWYRKGQYVEQDYTQAVKWYKLAASQGSQVAQNCLDLLYQNGTISEDITPEYSTGPSRKSRLCSKLRMDIDLLDNGGIKAGQIKKLAMDASKGDGNAMYEIGLNYYNGVDFTQDKDIGFKWIRNASNAEYTEAQFKLAEIYKQGDTVEQDYRKTSIWTKKLVKKKHDVAQYNLGILYRKGLGVRHDGLEASKWFILSSEQGNTDAMYCLAEMKNNFFSSLWNEEEAVNLFYKSAIGGNMKGYYSLGDIYLYPEEIPQDQDKALELYDYAARHGIAEAQYMVGSIYEDGKYVEADSSKARSYYEMISSTDEYYFDITDQYYFDLSFATKLLNGNVLTRDSKKAYSLFKLAEEKMDSSKIFQTPIIYYDNITNYYNLIDMFIEVSECGIDSLEYNIGCAFEIGIYSDTMDEVFTKDYKKALKWYSTSANKGDSRALYRLGIMHEEGKGTEKNLGTALDHYGKAADNDNVDAKYRLGCMYLTGYSIPKDIVKAFYLFTSAFNMGHLKSRKALMLSDGTEDTNEDEDDLTQDRDISFTEEDQLRMLETVAEEGLVAVQYQLGKHYQNRGDSKAIQWLTSAAQGGITDACYRLGVFYEEGTYALQNYERTIELYETASKGDHEDAIYRLAKLYQFGRGTPINYVKAYELYLRASEMGHLLSFKTLNITGDPWQYSTDTTQGISFDTTYPEYQQSILMCEHVAEQGNKELQYKLGTVYEHHLKEPDYSKALEWYRMAASNSHREATYRLGLLYEKGLGIDQDHKEAIRLFRQAKDMNSSNAIFSLGRAYQYGHGVDVDPLKATEYYTLAADLGNSQSQHMLGQIYEKGEMVQPNILEALKWYTKAYSHGYDAARSNLFDMYEDTPYEVFFYKKLHKILQLIVSTRLIRHFPDLYLSVYYNYHSACNKLGYWHYLHGNSEHAWTFFSKSVSNMESYIQNVDFLKTEAISSEDKNEILDKLQTQKKTVDNLDSLVLYNLGMGYYEGVFEEPTEDGFNRGMQHAESLLNNGTKSRTNTILKQDYRKALFFLEKAAEKGHHGAQYYLGEMYYHGHGVKTDSRKAQEWYDKASADTKEYSHKVGMVYHCDGELQNFSKALKNYEKCQYNHASLERGIMYIYGTGVERDCKKAIEQFKMLAPRAISYFYLGVTFYYGPDGIQDYTKAFRLFQKVTAWVVKHHIKGIFARYENDAEDSITKENYSFTLEPETIFQGEAYYYQGIMYTNGQGINQNEREAKNCFLKAVEHGNERAKRYTE